MRFAHRVIAYGVCAFVGMLLQVWDAIAESQAALEHDPSAMAWVGFLPFILPLFLAQSSCVVGLLALAIEAGLWLRRHVFP